MTVPCMCSLMGAHIRLNLPPALSLDVSPPARALANTHVHMRTLLGDTIRTSGAGCQNFPPFHVTC